MLNRTIAPPIVDAVNFNLQLQPCEKYVLKNGVEVFAINAGTEEVMLVEWVFDAGNWYEEKNLQAAVTNLLIKNGTSKKSAYDVNEYFEYYGAYLNRNCHSETAVVSLHCLTKHIKELLPVVREIFTDATLPPGEMKIAIQNMKQTLEVNLKKSNFVAGRLIDTYLFGKAHPYGRFSSFEAFDALAREDLTAFYDQYYKNGSFKIFVAGKFTNDVPRLLEQYFGDLENTAPPQPAYSICPATQKKYFELNDDKGSQASIRIARPFGNRHHPDFLNAQVLNVLFGGFFGSRLMTNIREEKGYTYGIHSYLMNNRHENAWMITTETGRPVSQATVEEVYKEMQQLCKAPVDQDELALVKNFMIGSILGDLDGPFHLLNRWKNIILNNLPEDYFNQTIQNIKNITAEKLMETANKFLIPEDFYELVVI